MCKIVNGGYLWARLIFRNCVPASMIIRFCTFGLHLLQVAKTLLQQANVITAPFPLRTERRGCRSSVHAELARIEGSSALCPAALQCQ